MKGNPVILILLLAISGMAYPVFGQDKQDKKKASSKTQNTSEIFQADDEVLNSTKLSTPRKSKVVKVTSDEIFDLINEANERLADSPSKSLDLVEEALGYSYNTGNKRSEAYSYNTLGAINYQLNRYDLAIENYLKAVAIFQQLGEAQGLYNSYKFLSSAYDARGENDKALEYYSVFLSKAEQAGNMDDIISTQNNIARIYFNTGKYELAKNRYLEVLRLEEQRKNQAGITTAWNHIGQTYDQKGYGDSALYYFKKAEALANSTGDKKSASQSLDNISDFYRSRNQPQQELQVQQKALATREEAKDIEGLKESNLKIGKIYLNQNLSNAAIPYLKRSVDLSEDLGALSDKGEAYEALSQAYEKIGDYQNALTSLKASRAITDSVQQEKMEFLQNSLAVNEELNRRDTRIATLMKDQELIEEKLRALEKEREAREANLHRQQIISYSLIAGLILVLVSGFFVLRSYNARRKANLLLTLKSLRAQMNPHFIFNSLNSVNSFIAKNDDRSANKYLADFSRLMRAVMENSQQDFVPLSAEVQILELYLSLEHFRFKDKFDYKFTVDPAIPRDSVDIPPMLIQPYIENAIWHGLRYKDEKGFLRVEIRQAENHLLVEVEDNGIGREKSHELKTKNQKTHQSTGLKNTAERLNIINTLYKKEITVKIDDVLDQGECKGTFVEIRIPFSHLSV
ncbi:MAG: tetratricopeptide repeat protein [Bacteroidia bacterium]